jgi:hypothetical protein
MWQVLFCGYAHAITSQERQGAGFVDSVATDPRPPESRWRGRRPSPSPWPFFGAWALESDQETNHARGCRLRCLEQQARFRAEIEFAAPPITAIRPSLLDDAMATADLYVKTGPLMSYGPNLVDLVRRAGVYVDKILKGTKSSIPSSS